MSQTPAALKSWCCRECREELGIIEHGRLRVRVGLAVEVRGTLVVVSCPADYRHRRAWDTTQRQAA